MFGWIIAGVLYVVGCMLAWLSESDGGERAIGLCDWVCFAFWPIITPFIFLLEAYFLFSRRWGRYRAHRRGFKDGCAGRPIRERPSYPQWYHEGYSLGVKTANQSPSEF